MKKVADFMPFSNASEKIEKIYFFCIEIDSYILYIVINKMKNHYI